MDLYRLSSTQLSHKERLISSSKSWQATPKISWQDNIFHQTRLARDAYWQFPTHQSSSENTAFCPGPGYSLWEFVVMSYGLTGTTETCQCALDEVFRKCHDCVDNYVDDIILFLDDMYFHINNLQVSHLEVQNVSWDNIPSHILVSITQQE